jgi:hypothetical protein
MESNQSFSYRLLYVMEPMFISSLHLNNENSDRVTWENAGIGNYSSLINMLFKLIKVD